MTAGVGGIGSMRREIRCWEGEKRKREKRGKVWWSIRTRCRRGSGGSEHDKVFSGVKMKELANQWTEAYEQHGAL
jgi:hypothetical protein